MTSTFDPGYDPLIAPARAFVFILIDGRWTAVGRVTIDLHREGRPQYTFTYGNKWRARPDAFALDPVHLPLDDAIAPLDRMFGAPLDAGPDRWGSRLLDERFAALLDRARAAPEARAAAWRRLPNMLDRLLLAGDDRVGALSFGPSPAKPLRHPAVAPIRDLAAIEDAMVRFDAGETVEPDLILMAVGTSLGGARPKVTVRRPDGSLWLAKFRRKSTDDVSVVRAEHAAMTLARAAGISVADTEVMPLGRDRETLLVRRFDRTGGATDSDIRRPYLSAISLAGRRDTDTGGSYLEIADRMRPQQVGCPRADLVELFRRMVFNAAIGNTDDHLRNHGFLRVDGVWRLSPAFDLVPCPDGADHQAISVGRWGTTPSRQNLMSECGRFGLDAEEAGAIVAQVATVVGGWREAFAARGVGEADLRKLGRCIGRLAECP